VYRVNIIFGPETIEVDTHGVGNSEAFLDFIALLGPMIPRYIVDFFEEHVKEEHLDKFLTNFLMTFIREYLDVTGLELKDLAKWVTGSPEGTVH